MGNKDDQPDHLSAMDYSEKKIETLQDHMEATLVKHREIMGTEKDKDPRQQVNMYSPPFSVNNRLILEPYKTDRALRANVSSGFATVEQKTEVKGLKVLVEARIFEGAGRQTNMIIPKGSTVYIREEILHNAPWALKILKSEGIEGPFIIVDLANIEFVKIT